MKTTLGGNRLGSGNKQVLHLRDYERSNHNLNEVLTTSIGTGTLVPFYVRPMMPGTTFDIELEADVMRHPTIGPLFGSYKLQLDMFEIPMSFYVPGLQFSQLGIGLDMASQKLPLIELKGEILKDIDHRQQTH